MSDPDTMFDGKSPIVWGELHRKYQELHGKHAEVKKQNDALFREAKEQLKKQEDLRGTIRCLTEQLHEQVKLTGRCMKEKENLLWRVDKLLDLFDDLQLTRILKDIKNVRPSHEPAQEKKEES